VGVVLRNLPPNSITEKIYNNCTIEGEKVIHVEVPTLVKNCY